LGLDHGACSSWRLPDGARVMIRVQSVSWISKGDQ
jgi:hypothetical protein